jgi:hypothetical protein
MNCLNTIYIYIYIHTRTQTKKTQKFELVNLSATINESQVGQEIRNEELFYLESNKERENRMIQRVKI